MSKRSLFLTALAMIFAVSLLTLPAQAAEWSNVAGDVKKSDWTQAWQTKTDAAFRKLLDKDVVLEPTAGPIRKGIDEVTKALVIESSMYEYCIFYVAAKQGNKTIYEFNTQTKTGLRVPGLTVLVTNSQNKITSIKHFHRPGALVKLFAEELAKANP